MIGLGGGPAGSLGASGRGSTSGSRRRPLGLSSFCCLPRKTGSGLSVLATSTTSASFRFLRERPPRRVSAESRLIGRQIGTGRSSSEAFETSLSTAFSDLRGALPLNVRFRPGFDSSATGFASAFTLESFLRKVTVAGAASVGGSISDFLPPRDFLSFDSGSALAALLGFFLAMLKNCQAAHSRSFCRVRNKASGRSAPPGSNRAGLLRGAFLWLPLGTR